MESRREAKLAILCCSSTCGGGDGHVIQFVEGVVITAALPPVRRVLENAGQKFFELYEQNNSSSEDGGDSSDFESDDKNETSGVQHGDGNKKKSHKRKKKKADIRQKLDSSKIRELLRKDMTLYKLLDVPDGSNCDVVKKSYRQKVLTMHPDKIKGHEAMTEEQRDKARERFHAIQEAYEYLSDPEIKIQYDSGLPFDVDVPSLVTVMGDFYGSVGPIFRSWARFSPVQPVPDIGDDNTDIIYVKAFYDFWYSFQSTRDYSQYDEFDLADATHREEKMFMENENKKQRRQYERKDQLKFKSLLEITEKNDPRIKRESERKRLLAESQKKERQERDRKARAEAAAKLLENEKKFVEAQKREEMERQERLRIESENEEKKEKLLLELKTLMLNNNVDENVVHFIDVEAMTLRENWKVDQVEQLLLKCNECAKENSLETHLIGIYSAYKKRDQENEKMKLKQKSVTQTAASKKPVEESVWTEEELHLLAKGINKFPGGTPDRWGTIARFIGTKTQKEVLTKSQAKGKSVRRGVDATKGNTPTVKQTDQTTSAPDAWSAEQQKALQEAMRTYPVSMVAKERWLKIGNAVDGKTAKQCLERFREIKAKMAK